MSAEGLEVSGSFVRAYNHRVKRLSVLGGCVNDVLRLASIALLFVAVRVEAEETNGAAFQPLPELGYRVVPDFFHVPDGMTVGEASGVALNSKGHIFLFQRATPMLSEYVKPD
jgi:hypothetical protein